MSSITPPTSYCVECGKHISVYPHTAHSTSCTNCHAKSMIKSVQFVIDLSHTLYLQFSKAHNVIPNPFIEKKIQEQFILDGHRICRKRVQQCCDSENHPYKYDYTEAKKTFENNHSPVAIYCCNCKAKHLVLLGDHFDNMKQCYVCNNNRCLPIHTDQPYIAKLISAFQMEAYNLQPLLPPNTDFIAPLPKLPKKRTAVDNGDNSKKVKFDGKDNKIENSIN